MKRAEKLLLDALGMPEVLRAARARMAVRAWDEIVGPLLAARSQPDRFDRGTLFVAVAGSAWASELRMKREVIRARLNAVAGDDSLFEDIRFGVRRFEKAETLVEPLAPKRVDYGSMSIREIAERRLRLMADESRTD